MAGAKKEAREDITLRIGDMELPMVYTRTTKRYVVFNLNGKDSYDTGIKATAYLLKKAPDEEEAPADDEGEAEG